MSALDVVVAVVLFFVGAVAALACFILWGNVQSVIALFGNVEADAAAAQFLNLIKMFDGFGVFLLFVMAIVIIVSSAMIRSHPLFVVPAIILMVIQVIVAGMFSNAYYGLVTATPELAAAAQNFPMTLFIFQHLPKFTLVIGVLAMVAAYGKVPFAPMAENSGGGQI